MSEFCFSFLEYQFRDIYLDCARMDKNLIEGDGVEAILIAGRIAEKVTKAIFYFEGIKEVDENQFKRIQKLSNANILPKNIKNDLSEIRRLRNSVYHNDMNLNKVGNVKSSNNKIVKSYVQRGGLRDYKTGFNKRKDYSNLSNMSDSNSSSNSNFNLNSNSNYNSNKYNPLSNSKNLDVSGELATANEAHKLCFNICVWFYINYSGDKEFIRPKYRVSRRTQDADFLIRLKSAINDGNTFENLRKLSPDNEILQILNEIYTKPLKDIKEKEENEKEEDNSSYSINNKYVEIRKPSVPYSECLGISYDDNFFLWKAQHGKKELGLFESPKEAFEEREKYIQTIPMPKKVDGDYSKARGISFSKLQKLWTASVKGKIISYHPSEKEAIKARKDYLKENDLIDVKVKDGFRTITLEQKAKLDEKARINSLIDIGRKEREKEIKTISNKSNIRKELSKDISNLINDTKTDLGINTWNKSSKSNSGLDSSSNLSYSSPSSKNDFNSKSKSNVTEKSNKLAYGEEFKKDSNKVHVVNGVKVSAPNKEIKKIKVIGGNRVVEKTKSKSKSKVQNKRNSNFGSKNKSKNKNKAKSKTRSDVSINKKKSSKYDGVFYEEGLFMWSAEVDGKHLGLYSSEEEARNKREEYIKNKSNN